MIRSSKRMSNRQVEKALSRIEDCAFRSKRDGCEVMLVGCAKCGRIFEEEVRSFRSKIISRSDLLCLACDGDALAPSVSAVVVRIGWDQ